MRAATLVLTCIACTCAGWLVGDLLTYTPAPPVDCRTAWHVVDDGGMYSYRDWEGYRMAGYATEEAAIASMQERKASSDKYNAEYPKAHRFCWWRGIKE